MKENIKCNIVLPEFVKFRMNSYGYTIRIVFNITPEMVKIIRKLGPRSLMALNSQTSSFDKLETFPKDNKWYFATERYYDFKITRIDDAIVRAYRDKNYIKIFFREIKKLVLDEEIEQIERNVGCDYDVDLPY